MESIAVGEKLGVVMGVVDQTVHACKPKNRLATSMGFLLGGVVPVATYLEAHCDLDPSKPLHTQLATYLVLGGLVFSAKTVYAWAKLAFDDALKALGFVVLLEGVMILSHVPVLPLVLLAILVAINGIATGCLLSLGRMKAAPKVERVEAVAEAPKARAKRAPRAKRVRVAEAAAAPVVAEPTAVADEAPASEKRSVSGVHEILAA